jgi:hypothetical protein
MIGIRLLVLLLLLQIPNVLYCQKISKAEYFIDVDPGINKGTPISFSASDSISISFDFNCDTLTLGQHFLYVRVKDSAGLWSHYLMKNFIVEDTFTQGQLIQQEYFIDKEPTPGKGEPIQIAKSDSIANHIIYNPDTLSSGIHYFYIRFKNELGLWSPYVMKSFFVEDTFTQGQLTQQEYFIDKEPTPGQGEPIQLAMSDTIANQIIYNTDTLSAGIHFFYVRFKNHLGLWSPYVMKSFTVEDTFRQGKLTQQEYFIDKEPTPGNGIQINMSATDTVSNLISCQTDTLSSGIHFFYVRFKNDMGLWSHYLMKSFTVEDTQPAPKIASYSHTIDSSLLNITAIKTYTFNPPVDSFNITQIITLDSLVDYGEHVYRIWIKGTNGLYTWWPEDSFAVIDCPMLDTAAIKLSGNLCAGDTVLFTQNITPLGIWPADSFNFSWSINGINAGTNDSLYVPSSNADSISLRFSFSKKSDHRCRGELNQWIEFSPLSNDTLTQKICANDSALIHGKYEKMAGFYTNKTQSSKGCDSIATIQLIINPVYLDTTKIVICEGDSVNVFGTYRYTSGSFSQKFISQTQCDSTKTVQLIVNKPIFFIDTFRICAGDTLFKHGKKFHTAGIYIDSFKTAYNCDSIYSTLISVLPIFYDSSQKIICSGDSIIIHGKFEKTTGNYVFKTKSKNGCDSTSIINLKVNKIYNDTLLLQICQGDSTLIHNVYQSKTGYYSKQFKSVELCDSFSTVMLQVNAVFNLRDTFMICAGDTLVKHGKKFFQTGQYIDTFKTIKGCDSIYTTQVIVNAKYNDTLYKQICSGDSIVVHGKFVKSSGLFVFNAKSIAGCDSTSTIQLTVNPIYRDTLYFEICQGDSMRIHGSFQKQSDTYIFKGKTQKNCDSTVTIFLKVNATYKMNDTFAICAGDSVQRHGKSFKIQGNFTDAFKSVSGCDSVYTTTIITNQVYNINLIVGRCGGDSVMFDGAYRYKTGVYSAMYKTVNGCDSSVRLNLSIDTLIRVDQYPVICFGDSMLIDGIYRKQKGDYTETYKALAGCDSFVVKHLTILPSDTTNLNQILCFSEVYNFYGKNIDKEGKYTAVLKNRNGCDSVLLLDVKIRNRNAITLQKTICFGDSLFVGNSYKKGTGNFVDTLTDQFGCDSIVFYQQTERKQVSTPIKLSICKGDSIYSGFGFKKEEGTYFDTLQNIFGCDSLVVTELILKPVATTLLHDTICFGETIKFFGNELKDPGSYNHTLQNLNGCDSIITMNLQRRAQFIPKIIGFGYASLTTDTTYNSYQWLLNRQPLQGENARTIIIQDAGVYDVTVSNELGCFANSWDDFLNTTSLTYENLIRLFPNPAAYKLTLIAPLTSQVAVYNNIGKLVIFENTVSDQSNLDIAHLKEGVYLAVIRYQNYVYTSKIIIAR